MSANDVTMENYVDKVSFRWFMGILIIIMSTAAGYSFYTRTVVDKHTIEVNKSLDDYESCLARDYATKKELNSFKIGVDRAAKSYKADQDYIKLMLQELCIKNGIPVNKAVLSGK